MPKRKDEDERFITALMERYGLPDFAARERVRRWRQMNELAAVYNIT